MDWVGQHQLIREAVKKYRFVIFAALLGIFLMLLPENTTEEPVPEQEEISLACDLEQSLEILLSELAGAGHVRVLLTEQQGAQTVYQTDDVITESEHRKDTVLVTDDHRSESGLIQQVRSPVYRGAVVLCQGAGNAQVRLAVVEAVKCATGLSSDHITVLKMK